jgi:glyoxylase-like metal-dependent hydrolase (beta-lactamase superfamily II)
MARRQEQESARSEVTEVAPNILRMELPIRLPGLGHVNMYALVDKDGAAVLDPGLPGPATWKAIQERLAQAQLRVKDVHTVLISHSHPDHFGCAVRFQKEAGSRVIAHRSFSFGPVQASQPSEVSVDDLEAQHGHAHHHEPVVDAGKDPDVPDSPPPIPWGGKTPWGGQRPRPPWRRRVQWRAMRWLGKGFLPVISDPVEHGDELILAGREMFVQHTPGHTGDHFCLHDPGTGTLLAGDHVLPSITPHISGMSSSRDPLASFFYSLDRVAEISGVGQVLPAHGHPFDDLPGRTEAIKRHHHERLEKVKEISRDYGRPATTREFSEHLFSQRNWGSMADSETYAHLEHLRLLGEAERSEGADGAPRYLAR